MGRKHRQKNSQRHAVVLHGKNLLPEVKRQNMLAQGSGANTWQDRGAAQRIPAQSTQNPYYEQNFYRRCHDYLKMFNTSWEVQKLITIPVDDAMKYRVNLKGLDDDDAKRIWEVYDRMNLDKQNRRALVQERLLSGCAMLGIFRMDDPSTARLAHPLRLSEIQPGDFEAVNIIDVMQLSIGAEIYNPFSSNYDRQPDYLVNGVRVDKSRMMVLDGDPIVGRFTKSQLEGGRYNRIGFGESKITPLYDLYKMATGTQQGAFHLVNLASCIVLEIDKFRSMRATNSGAIDALEQLAEQFSIYRAAMVDAQGVKVNQHAASFGSVPELMMMFMQFLSAASDIPATRFLGQAPGGLNATGESDLQNYYDMVRGAVQTSKLKPMQQREIDWIGCGLWGFQSWMQKRQSLELEYPELWNETAKEKADRMSLYVTMIKSLMDSGAINGEAAVKELKARGAFVTDIEAEKALAGPMDLEPSPLDPGAEIQKLRGKSASGFRAFNAKDWDESEHPRAEDGKFGEKGEREKTGESSSGAQKKLTKAKASTNLAANRSPEKTYQKLKESPTVSLAGNEVDLFSRGLGYAAIRKAMPEWAKTHGITGTFDNSDTGWNDIEIRPKGIKDAMEHGPGEEKIKSIPALPELIRNGVYLDSEVAHNPRQIGMTSHVFAAKLMMLKKPMLVGYIIKEDMNGKRFYDHEFTEMKNLDELSPKFGAAPDSGGRHPDARQGLINKILHKFLFVK